MARFLFLCLRFFLPLAILLGALYLFVSWSVRDQMRSYLFPDGVSILAMGDSHIQAAVCDTILHRVRNVAQTNEGFIYTYYKLIALTHSNPTIDTVILGAGYHSFSDYYDDYLYNPAASANYFWILPPLDQLSILQQLENPGQFLAENIWSEITRLWNPPTDTLWLGNWSNPWDQPPPTEASIGRRIADQFYSGTTLRGRSELNATWFSRIAEWSRDRGITLLVLPTPVTDTYASQVPEYFIDLYEELLARHNLQPICCDGITFTADDFLPDGDHLSGNGSIRYSRCLKETLFNRQH